MSKIRGLSPERLKRLEKTMRRVQAGGGLNLEQTDGFFAGLMCLPDPADPEEFFEVVFGHCEDEWESDAGRAEAEPGASQPPTQLPMQDRKPPPVEPDDELLDMLMLLYDNKIRARRNGIFDSRPLLLPDDAGRLTGQDWARGFLDCLAWDGCLEELEKQIDEDDESPVSLAFIPLMALASGVKPVDTYEYGDPEAEPAAEAAEKPSGVNPPCGGAAVDEAAPGDEDEITYVPLDERDLRVMLEALPASVNTIYRTLRGESEDAAGAPQAKSEKIPRNVPCPCGSGKKYKQCCLPRGED